MPHTRSRATAKPSAPLQHLNSVDPATSSHSLSPSTTSLRRSSRRPSSIAQIKVEPPSKQQEDATLPSSNTEAKEEDAGLTEYERKRRENIQRNLAFMQQMGVSTAKIQARTAVGLDAGMTTKQHEVARKRAHQAAKKAERLTQPIRKSRRLEGKQVEVEPIDTIDQFDMEKPRGGSTPRSSNLRVLDAVDGESKAFLGTIVDDEASDGDEDVPVDQDDGVEYTLADHDIVKAVQERIYAVAFLPRRDRIVVACGDKVGHLALWTPGKEAQAVSSPAASLAVYRPHSTPLTQLIFSNKSTLLSSSFDGSVREFDLRAAASSLVYETRDKAGISSLVEAGTLQCYYASCDDGSVRLIDRRASTMQSARYQLHEKKVNTVHQHPRLDFCLATASLDRTVCLWDARRLARTTNPPLVTLPHARSVNCAYFSPREGEWLVTVGQDSYIDMFATSSLAEQQRSKRLDVTLPAPLRVRHNNLTGRWLTKLHAAWDVKRPNHFVIGCMEQPRRLQIFQAGRRRPVRELVSENFASVHSINAFHPHVDLLAGGNSSGRLALWRGHERSKE